MSEIIGLNDISKRIYFIRGVKVMRDRDLASIYGAETKVLKQTVAEIQADFLTISCLNSLKRKTDL